jgi:hypothetical protein
MAIDPRYWPKCLRDVAVVCDCEEGDKINADRIQRKWKPVARWNARMARFTPGMTREDAAAEIHAAMAIENHANYRTEFDDYNQQPQGAF